MSLFSIGSVAIAINSASRETGQTQYIATGVYQLYIQNTLLLCCVGPLGGVYIIGWSRQLT